MLALWLIIQPVMIAMKNSIPARFPKNETTQILLRSRRVTLRCKNAVIMNYTRFSSSSRSVKRKTQNTMTLLVNRSAPVRTIMTRPTGKSIAPVVRMRPGAFSWYHGADDTISRSLWSICRKHVEGMSSVSARKGVIPASVLNATAHLVQRQSGSFT